MAAKRKNNSDLFEKLKKQVALLTKKETQGRQKLDQAIKKARQLGKTYKTKLSKVVEDCQSRLSKIQTASYAKLAKDVQQQLIKTIEAKGNAIVNAIARVEKKYGKKRSAKKGKRTSKKA